MTTSTQTPRPATPAGAAREVVSPQPVEPRPVRWTREQYYALGKLGHFDGKRVQLFDGEIIEMPPQGNWHAVVIGKTLDALAAVFPRDQFWTRGQNPLEMPHDSEPEPDVAVVRGSPDDFTAHPTTALLVVEVAATSLRLDRKKTNAYAAAGVEDYWIVDIGKHQVEVYRRPVADAGEPFGYVYQSVEVLRPGARIVPVAAPQASVAVADLLPKQPVEDPGA